MADGRGQGLAYRRVLGLLRGGTAAGWSDGDLVERFRTREGEVAELAFAALVERHGPMVLRTCRAALGDLATSQADDAYQAVFLVLARRSAAIRPGDTLGPWLRQVALRVCRNARRVAQRRERHEAASARGRGEVVRPAPSDGWPELHEEMERLPARLREPLALCYLDGLTHDQAAARLGWPLGTVRSRLARGRERLKTALIRRGVSPAVALSLHLPRLSPPAASALVPHSLRELTIRTAVRVGRDSAAVPTGLALLVAEGSRQISWSGAKLMYAVVSASLFAGVLAFVPAQAPGDGKPAAVAPVASQKILTIPLPTPEHTVSILLDGPDGSKTYAVVPDGQGSLAVMLTQTEKDARKTWRFRADGIALQPGPIKPENARGNPTLMDDGVSGTTPLPAEKAATEPDLSIISNVRTRDLLEDNVRLGRMRTDRMFSMLEMIDRAVRNPDAQLDDVLRDVARRTVELHQESEARLKQDLALQAQYAKPPGPDAPLNSPSPALVRPKASEPADLNERIKKGRASLDSIERLLREMDATPTFPGIPTDKDFGKVRHEARLLREELLSKLRADIKLRDQDAIKAGTFRRERIAGAKPLGEMSIEEVERALEGYLRNGYLHTEPDPSVRLPWPQDPVRKKLEFYDETITNLKNQDRYAHSLIASLSNFITTADEARKKTAEQQLQRVRDELPDLELAIRYAQHLWQHHADVDKPTPDQPAPVKAPAREPSIAEMEEILANDPLLTKLLQAIADQPDLIVVPRAEATTPLDRFRKSAAIEALLDRELRRERVLAYSIWREIRQSDDVSRAANLERYKTKQKTLADLEVLHRYATKLRDHDKSQLPPNPATKTEAAPAPAAKPFASPVRPAEDPGKLGDLIESKAQADMRTRLFLLDADIEVLRAEIRRLGVLATIARVGPATRMEK